MHSETLTSHPKPRTLTPNAGVALRNALDDMDTTPVKEVASTLGPLGGGLDRAIGFFEQRAASRS